MDSPICPVAPAAPFVGCNWVSALRSALNKRDRVVQGLRAGLWK